MYNAPKTLEEARKYLYKKWAGNPNGEKYRESDCAYEVWDMWHGHQCFNKNGKGINGLYCGVHAKKVLPE